MYGYGGKPAAFLITDGHFDLEQVLLEKDPWEEYKEDLADKIKYGILKPPEALQDAQYDGCWSFIAQCISKEPSNRITATTAIAIIQSIMEANGTH
jgi:hypothetical protein